MLIGYAKQPVIWQGAKPHGPMPVGLTGYGPDGKATHPVGKLGCVPSATAMALRLLGAKAGATVVEVMEAAKRARDKVYPDPERPASAVVPELVRAQKGLIVGEDVPGAGVLVPPGPDVLRPLLLQCFARGGVALVCVDYDRDLPAGDPTGEHWCCARGVEPFGRLYLADPATAKDESVDLATLSGPVHWGSVVRPYVVVRVVTVYRG